MLHVGHTIHIGMPVSVAQILASEGNVSKPITEASLQVCQ